MKTIVCTICFSNLELGEVKRRNEFRDDVALFERTPGVKVQLLNLDDNPPFTNERPFVQPPYLVIEGIIEKHFRVLQGNLDDLIRHIQEMVINGDTGALELREE